MAVNIKQASLTSSAIDALKVSFRESDVELPVKAF
jgi:hypothetical protein